MNASATYFDSPHGAVREALGTHVLLDLTGVGPLLDDLDKLRSRLIAAAKAGGATVVEDRFHRFAPQGISGVVILAESHVAVHTWPERDFAAVDIFTCSGEALAQAVTREVVAALGATEVHSRQLVRGTMHDSMGDASAGRPTRPEEINRADTADEPAVAGVA